MATVTITLIYKNCQIRVNNNEYDIYKIRDNMAWISVKSGMVNCEKLEHDPEWLFVKYSASIVALIKAKEYIDNFLINKHEQI